LLAKAFSTRYGGSETVWIYAAGVSNSGCVDPHEFERERTRLTEALGNGGQASAFVYFSTCSISDPVAAGSAYVQHKREMEKLVSQHPGFVVVRSPQVAGRTPNPHTLLNYLYARITRSERFPVWIHAKRNIIDVDDVAAIVEEMLKDPGERRITVNVASPVSHSILAIVAALEKVTGKRAVTKLVDDGAPYAIDTSAIGPIIGRLGLAFDDEYIVRVARKYYGASAKR
jgi:nucleoside-diphosphate-sugar epimerase